MGGGGDGATAIPPASVMTDGADRSVAPSPPLISPNQAIEYSMADVVVRIWEIPVAVTVSATRKLATMVVGGPTWATTLMSRAIKGSGKENRRSRAVRKPAVSYPIGLRLAMNLARTMIE